MGTGTIGGLVSDPSGSPAPAATVTALQLSTRTSRSATTNASGNYVFTNMPIGQYEITAELPGFKKVVQQGVRLDADTTATVDIQLQIGAVQESVTVSAAPPALQTENGEGSNLVTGAQVSELSLNGRNFSQFLALGAGVASNQTGRRMGVGQEGNPLMSINGGRINSTKFTYDGVLAMDTGGNRGLNLFPPMDAIAEVQVKTSNFSAREGSYGYGLVNVITKTGGSDFHGDLYEVFGNTNLDARNFFDSRVSPFHQNMFGGTLGGPVFIPGHYNKDKNKTFFFVSEGWNLRQGPQVVNYTSPPQSTFTATTLTAAQRAGVFTSAIKDPTTNQNFANNRVPANRIDPNSTALLDLFYPLPNSAGAANYVYSPNAASRWREDLVRVDQQLSKNFFSLPATPTTTGIRTKTSSPPPTPTSPPSPASLASPAITPSCASPGPSIPPPPTSSLPVSRATPSAPIPPATPLPAPASISLKSFPAIYSTPRPTSPSPASPTSASALPIPTSTTSSNGKTISPTSSATTPSSSDSTSSASRNSIAVMSIPRELSLSTAPTLATPPLISFSAMPSLTPNPRSTPMVTSSPIPTRLTYRTIGK